MRIAIQIRELVSSNVGAALDRAEDPRKMLALLQREIENAVVEIEGERSRARRALERSRQETAGMQARLDEWDTKAKTAIDHQREDLARRALEAKADCREDLAERTAQAARLEAEVAEYDSVLAGLEARHAEVRAKVQDYAQPAHQPARARPAGAGDSPVERRLDRLGEIERRVDFATANRQQSPCADDVDSEIAALHRQAAIDAELARLAAPRQAKAAKARRK